MRKILSFVMALVLGFTFASAETVTLYCKVTQGWWTSDDAAVALHCWGGTGETSWPGVRMSPVEGEEGLWVATMDKSNTGFMFVRVNGSGDVSDWGAKTANLSLPEDDKDLYTITSSSAVWGDPGVTGEWSKYEPAGEQGGEGGESGEGGEGGEEGGEGGEEQPVENVNVFFVNVPGWAAVNAYAWAGEVKNADWPGAAMTKTEAKVNEKEVYSISIAKTFVNIIFNNGTDQTSDLTFDATKPYFCDGAWYANAEAIPAAGGEGGEGGEEGGEGGESGEGGEEGGEGGEEQPVENVNVFFVNVPGWEAVNVYAWDAQGPKAVWPGEAMTKTEAKVNEKDVFSFALPKNFVNIIFNNGTDQTGDLTLDATKPYFCDGAWYANAEAIPAAGGEGGEEGGEGGEEQPGTAQPLRVYCKVAQEWWGDAAVGAYAWTENAPANAEWPGVRMQAVEGEDNVWFIDLDTVAFNKVVFTRVNPSDEGDLYWGAKTEDQIIPRDGKNLFTLTSTEAQWDGDGNKAVGEWSVKGASEEGGEGGEEGGEGGEEQPGTAQPLRVYCKVAQEWWGDAAVGAYAWTENAPANAEWPGVRMQAVEGEDNVWFIDLDTVAFNKVVFTRVNPSDEGDLYWGAKTEDQIIPRDGKNLFILTSTEAQWDGDGNKAVGEWSVKGASEEGGEGGEEGGEGGEQGEGLANGFYLIGQNGWDIAALNSNLLFTANPGADNEFNLVVTLEEGQSLKVVKVENNAITAWYPDGMDNEYKVDAEHAGNRTIYFQETYKEDWAQFGGFMFISSDVTALDNTTANVKAVKFIENGQLFIIVNTRVFNAAGQIVR